MTTATKPTTAAELLNMPDPPDGSHFELIRGELVAMTPAGGRHGEITLAIGAILRGYVKEHGLGRVVCNDTGVFTGRDPDTVLAPDIAFWSRARLPEMPEGFVEVPPDLVVEVVSPSDTQAHLHQKVLEYLDHEVALVWVVDPKTRTATVYGSRRDVRILGENDDIEGRDVLPGFSCGVGEFFQ
jgi:Uma2 family endonuclease